MPLQLRTWPEATFWATYHITLGKFTHVFFRIISCRRWTDSNNMEAAGKSKSRGAIPIKVHVHIYCWGTQTSHSFLLPTCIVLAWGLVSHYKIYASVIQHVMDHARNTCWAHKIIWLPYYASVPHKSLKWMPALK